MPILSAFPAFCLLLELQTDSNGYKQKSLILRHFQKRLDPINHYEKEKKCNKNAMEYITCRLKKLPS